MSRKAKARVEAGCAEQSFIDRRKFTAGCALGLLTACGAFGGGAATVRFKVTARALVDGQTYEGAAVNEIRARYTPNALSGFQMAREMRAEATVVDVGKRDALFVLLVDYLDSILRAYDIAPSVGSADETTIAKLKAASGAVDYFATSFGGKRDLPRIASFRDEADPTSVYQINPDDLAKTHGPGAQFLGLSIEIVDPTVPLTNSIQHRLDWLDLNSGQTIDPLPPRGLPSGSTTFGQVVGHGAFKSER